MDGYRRRATEPPANSNSIRASAGLQATGGRPWQICSAAGCAIAPTCPDHRWRAAAVAFEQHSCRNRRRCVRLGQGNAGARLHGEAVADLGRRVWGSGYFVACGKATWRVEGVVFGRRHALVSRGGFARVQPEDRVARGCRLPTAGRRGRKTTAPRTARGTTARLAGSARRFAKRGSYSAQSRWGPPQSVLNNSSRDERASVGREALRIARRREFIDTKSIFFGAGRGVRDAGMRGWRPAVARGAAVGRVRGNGGRIRSGSVFDGVIRVLQGDPGGHSPPYSTLPPPLLRDTFFVMLTAPFGRVG